MIAVVLSVLVGPTAGLAAAGLATGAYRAPGEETVAALVQGARSEADAGPLAQRLAQVTDLFVGAPYLLSPLGEGPGAVPDADPLMRFDAFDCTTFVETALSLAVADDLMEARELLKVIRYREGRVDYLARRHFPEAEWIPELTALGFLQDVTREVGGSDVVMERKILDLSVWKRNRNDKTPPLPDERIPRGEFSLDVWPLQAARAGQDKIPIGAVLHLVRVDFASVPMRVSHQGLVIEKNGKRYLRHAADRMYHSVVDEPLDHFFSRMQKYRKWPVSGVHVTRIVRPSSWRALLPVAPRAPLDPHAASVHAPL